MTHYSPSESQQWMLTWLRALVGGEDAVLGALDDDMARDLKGARLEGLAISHGAGHSTFGGLEREAFMRGATHVAAATRCVAILAAAGVRSVILKGAPLATVFWPGHDVIERSTSDVDILVAPGNVDAAQAALLSAGLADIDRFAPWYRQRWHFHNVFTMERPPSPVELHWDLMVPVMGRLPIDEIIADAVNVTTADGRSLPAPDASWQFISACIHAVQHVFDLRCLLDIAFVAHALDDTQWERVAALAEHSKIGPLVWFASRASADLLLWQVAPELERLKPGPVRTRLLLRYLARHPVLEPTTTTGSRIWRVFLPVLSGSSLRWLVYLPMTLLDRPRLAGLIPRRRATPPD